MMSALLTVLLVLAPGQASRPRPVAMVLEVEDRATLRRGGQAPQALHDMDLLLPGDRLHATAGTVTLVLLKDGQVERLAPGRNVTVAAEGCTPVDAVVRRQARLSGANLSGLRALARSSSGGVGMLRGAKIENVPAVHPLYGSTVLTRRPTLSWPPVKGATAYDVRLYSGQGRDRRLEWKETTTEPRLPYPARQRDLPLGVVRYWEVTARTGDDQEIPAVQSRFSVATAAEMARLAKLQPLARSTDPNDWLVAAAAYEAAGAFNKALPLYEKVAAKRPGQPHYQRVLARYYVRAGLKDKAEEARKRAEKLRAEVGQE